MRAARTSAARDRDFAIVLKLRDRSTDTPFAGASHPRQRRDSRVRIGPIGMSVLGNR